MKLLWDTHTFLWFIAGSEELSEAAKEIILRPESENFISIVSLWEISIKVSINKLTINGTIESIWQDIQKNGLIVLPIQFDHIVCQSKLPLLHRDPFDRIIIAQALCENMQILGRDASFDAYLEGKTIKRCW